MISITEGLINGKLKNILLVTKGKASNNLVKHLQNGDGKSIQKQVNRGSVQVFGMAADKKEEQ